MLAPLAGAWLLVLCMQAPTVLARDPGSAAADPEQPEDTGVARPDHPQPRPAATEFETIRVIGKRPEWVDPFAYRPKFDPDDNMFARRWNEPPSVEEVSLNGGYILLGINYGLMKAAQSVMRLPGWQNQIQPAVARPPPLDEAQAERAARLREAAGP